MKIISMLFFLIFIETLFAQGKIPLDSIHRNEIRFNVLKFAFNSRIEVTYERLLTDIFSVGITSISSEDKFAKKKYLITAKTEYVNEYQIIPFFRYSNTSNKTENIYVEAFSSINGGRFKKLVRNENQEFAYYEVSKNRYINVAVGAALGVKFYIIKRLAVDTNIGFGANIKRKYNEVPEGIARFGVHIGYKF